MKFRNVETGVILEPCSREAEAALSNDHRYVVVESQAAKRTPGYSKKHNAREE